MNIAFAMEPLTFLPAYNIVVCCGQGKVADEVASHLQRAHHVSKQKGEEIAQNIRDIPGIIRTQAELARFELPRSAVEPIPELEAPAEDGMKCHHCSYVGRQVKLMQKHCSQAHGWQNDRTRGRPTKRQAQQHQAPWTSGVRCQRFFKSRYASAWFEVRAGADQEPRETDEQRVWRIAEQEIQRFDEAQEAEVQEAGQKDEPNLWLRRVGWATHVEGLDRERLIQAVGPIQSDEQGLRRMWESFQRVAEAAQSTARASVVGHAALFEVNRKQASVKATKPFDSQMEEDGWKRYVEVFRKVVCFVWRTQKWDDESRPAYVLTEKQGNLLDGNLEQRRVAHHRRPRRTLRRLGYPLETFPHPPQPLLVFLHLAARMSKTVTRISATTA